MDHFAYNERVAREREISRVFDELGGYSPSDMPAGHDLTALEQRVAALEKHHDFLVDVVNALLDHMYGPDDAGKPEAVVNVIQEFIRNV